MVDALVPRLARVLVDPRPQLLVAHLAGGHLLLVVDLPGGLLLGLLLFSSGGSSHSNFCSIRSIIGAASAGPSAAASPPSAPAPTAVASAAAFRPSTSPLMQVTAYNANATAASRFSLIPGGT